MKPIFPFGTEREDDVQLLPGDGRPAVRREELCRASGKFARLSSETQEVLTALALIGNTSSPTTLALVLNESVEALCPKLQEGIDSGFMVRQRGGYWFADDEVEEAVLSAIPEPEREAGLLRIGTLLASMATAEAANWLENIRLYRESSDRDWTDRDSHVDIIHANRLKMVGQMTASIAHEVSQPIAASVMNAQAALHWLSAEPANLDEAREALSRVVTNGNRASEVLSRIRAIIRKGIPHKDPVDVNDAVREMAEFTGAETARNHVHVATDFASGSPVVLGDRVELQQVILNMIVNAIEAMRQTRKQGRSLSISTRTNEVGEVLVAVADSGPGIESGQLEHVFRPFHTTKRAGLGIGLAVCRSIIEAHGGRMWAEANKSRGMVFQFSLQAAPVGTQASSSA
jgi:signal transduction histidine kinase